MFVVCNVSLLLKLHVSQTCFPFTLGKYSSGMRNEQIFQLCSKHIGHYLMCVTMSAASGTRSEGQREKA